ncbi:MAG: ribosomal protein S18-alanine N-acetyltransferase, partial [Acholeplasmatales bacterium]|nr:ribosomal protein S18-alanine N-acetyltransferase [Acholeplasmatales bacterium]
LELDTLGTTLGSEMLEDNLSNSMSHFYVYEDRNEIIGYISISFDGEQGEILNFCVNKGYQHNGIGTKLLAYAINILHSKGAKSFILEVRESNIGAISLYEKFGFKRISLRKNYYSNNENALVYLKEMISYKEVEEAYILTFCKKEVHEDYIYYHDDELKTKYYHNYYVCKNDDNVMESLYHRKSFVQFDLEHPYTGKLKFSDYEYEIEYHSSIFGLHVLRNNTYRVEKLKECDSSWAYEYFYKDTLKYGEEYSKENTKRILDVCLKEKRIDYYFVYDIDKPVGFIEVFQYKDAAKLENFSILEEYQKKGYGSCLFNHVLNELKRMGIKDIYLTADYEDTPKVMYERMGFTMVGRSYQVREVFK